MLEFKERQELKLGRIFAENPAALNRLESIFSGLSLKYGLGYKNVLEILRKREDYAAIPASIFNNNLSPLENVVFYLKEGLGFSQSQIAGMLKRDHTTIWTTLENALKKGARLKKETGKSILIPAYVFANRRLSILESLSVFVMKNYGLSYHQAALLLGKDDRTIWTVVSRAKKKLRRCTTL